MMMPMMGMMSGMMQGGFLVKRLWLLFGKKCVEHEEKMEGNSNECSTRYPWTPKP